ncbi:MAG: acetyl-CoA decarbonylase/synthase complex subunit gamma, partial [Candidatus Methanomethylicota archaeon]
EKCTPLFEDPKYASKKEELLKLIRPPVKEVSFGVPPNEVKIGGKDVVYRHEWTWRFQTALMIDVHDEMPEEEFTKRIDFVNNFSYIRIGKKLTLDGLAIRCCSGIPEKFAKVVSKVMSATEKPFMICSFDPNALEEALIVARDRKPLIYAANEKNWKDVAQLASKFGCPVVISAPGNPELLKSLVKSIKDHYGLDDLVLDPGTYVNSSIIDTISLFSALRYAAIEGEDRLLGYPLLGVPAVAWLMDGVPDEEKSYVESILAVSLMARYADILVMHSVEIWPILPAIIWRDCVYTDPRIPPSVKPGLYEIGKPDENSPLLVTGNFALTYYIVKDDVEKAKLNAWLLVIDTEGTSVQSAVAGKKFTSDKIAEAIEELKLEEKVKHKSIILPGYAARLSGELEDMLKTWRVFVGPRDSADIKKFIDKMWIPEIFGNKKEE